MIADPPKAETLRELLLEIRGGFMLHKPILIALEQGDQRSSLEATMDRTMTLSQPMAWVEQYGASWPTTSSSWSGRTRWRPGWSRRARSAAAAAATSGSRTTR
jgi:hypothetical protein